MQGSVNGFPEVMRLYALAAEDAVHVDVIWKPRTHEWLQYADALSEDS